MSTRTRPTLRRATVEDASRIAQHRHKMFADNQFASEGRLNIMDTAFEPWVRAALIDGSYVGFILELNGEVLGGAGIYFMPFPPHWMHDEPRRAYLLNFYVAPEARGHGIAKQLLRACLAFCRDKEVAVVALHASPQGRPIYEQHGFTASTEMMLRLSEPKS